MSSQRYTGLSKEELDTIRRLYEDTLPTEEPTQRPRLLLQLPDEFAGLMDELLTSPIVELQVGSQECRLRFPLVPTEGSDDQEPSFEIGIPEILEGREHVRSLRVQPGAEVLRVHDRSGLLEPSRVLNLSFTGLAVEGPATAALAAAKALNDLRLDLPGHPEELHLSGAVVRQDRLDDAQVRLGIRFEPHSSDARDQLRRYIFHRHRELRSAHAPGARQEGRKDEDAHAEDRTV